MHNSQIMPMSKGFDLSEVGRRRSVPLSQLLAGKVLSLGYGSGQQIPIGSLAERQRFARPYQDRYGDALLRVDFAKNPRTC